MEAELRKLARGIVSYATALAVSSQYRLKVGNIDLMPNDCIGKSELELVRLFQASATSEQARFEAALESSDIAVSIREYHERL